MVCRPTTIASLHVSSVPGLSVLVGSGHERTHWEGRAGVWLGAQEALLEL